MESMNSPEPKDSWQLHIMIRPNNADHLLHVVNRQSKKSTDPNHTARSVPNVMINYKSFTIMYTSLQNPKNMMRYTSHNRNNSGLYQSNCMAI